MSFQYGAPLPTPQASTHPWQAHTVEIRDKRAEIAGVATYDLVFRDKGVQSSYRFAPGQFNMLYLPGAGEIAISVSDDPSRTSGCRHTIRTAGNVTQTLAKLPLGETLGLRGPFGSCWPLADCIGRDVVLVAGGIGLAPLRPAIYRLLERRRQFGRLNLVYGARRPATLLYTDEYDTWEKRGLRVHTTVDRSEPNWAGNVGVVTVLLERLRTFDPQNTTLLCCGPEVMMKFTMLKAQSLGIDPDQLWISMERNMQCAIGLCGHCQWGPEFVCKDGPVFPFSRIADLIDIEQL